MFLDVERVLWLIVVMLMFKKIFKIFMFGKGKVVGGVVLVVVKGVKRKRGI